MDKTPQRNGSDGASLPRFVIVRNARINPIVTPCQSKKYEVTLGIENNASLSTRSQSTILNNQRVLKDLNPNNCWRANVSLTLQEKNGSPQSSQQVASQSMVIKKYPIDDVISTAREIASKLTSEASKNPRALQNLSNGLISRGLNNLNRTENSSQISLKKLSGAAETNHVLAHRKKNKESIEGKVSETEDERRATTVTHVSSESDFSDDDFQPRKKPSGHKSVTTSPQSSNVHSRKVPGCRKKEKDKAKAIEKFKEDSLTNPSFEKVHESLPKMMPDYVVTYCTSDSDKKWKGIIRVNITDRAEAEDWLRSYVETSFCDFRVRIVKKENTKRLVYKRVFRCHHNTMPRKKKAEEDGMNELSNASDHHTGNASKYRDSKHTCCPTTVTITIKNKSMAWSSDDLLQDYPCEITINHVHNHPVVAADALRHRRPSNETKEKFLKLFAEGYSPLAAIECHKFDLMMEHGDQFTFAMADGAICPSNFWVYKLFKKENIKVHGPQAGLEMVEALKAYCLKYNEAIGSECMKVELLNDRDLIVAICDPMMKRVHELLRSAGEMMFMDSSGSMDALNFRVFLILTPSVAGALPLGILVMSSESSQVLGPALELWKSLLPPKAFFGRGAEAGPKIAMIDDCAAEKKSLHTAFPLMLILLCLFHLLQAFWRYVWKIEHNVPLIDRAPVFFLFKDLVYAEDQTTFESRLEDLKSDPRVIANPGLLGHIMSYVERSPEWALFQRVDLLTRGHNTDNYSEATIRILKDKVFERLKAYNPVQMVDFLVTRFIRYLEMRITDVLNNRSLHPYKSRFFIRPEKLEGLATERLSNFHFKVTNLVKGTEYIVVMEQEVCSCPEGRSGKPCKHLCKVVQDFNLSSGQFLPRLQSGDEMKLILFEIIHGHRNVPDEWFRPLKSSSSVLEPETNAGIVSGNSPEDVVFGPSSDEGEHPEASVAECQFSDEDVSNTTLKLDQMFSEWRQYLLTRPDVFLKPFQAFMDFNEKHKSSDAALSSAIITFGKNMPETPPLNFKRKNNASMIPIHSTSKGRRTVYLEGRTAQRGGRPPKGANRNEPEHNYVPSDTAKSFSVAKRKTTDLPHWAALPKRSKLPAPNALQVCVEYNRSNGGNHGNTVKKNFVKLTKNLWLSFFPKFS